MRCASCRVCYHQNCVREWHTLLGDDDISSGMGKALQHWSEGRWMCPGCRCRHLDPFTPIALTMGSWYVNATNLDVIDVFNREMNRKEQGRGFTFDLDGTPVEKWKSKGLRVHLRSVRCDGADFSGPYWPETLRLFVNGMEKLGTPSHSTSTNAVEPPQMGHVRKEPGFFDLTELLRGGQNRVQILPRINIKQKKEEDGIPPKHFLIGVYVCKQVPWEELRVKTLISMHSACENNGADSRIKAFFEAQ